jgi:HEPN domain-containing protein
MTRQGIDLAKQATEKDHEGAYEDALRLYEQAVQYLITGLKCMYRVLDTRSIPIDSPVTRVDEKNKSMKEMITKKCEEYLVRAEKLKEVVKNGGKVGDDGTASYH